MIKVSSFYPHAEGKKFDMDYFCNRHMSMVRDRLGAACSGMAVEQGLSGPVPGSPPTYIAFAHMYFESVDAFRQAFGAHMAEIMADIPNYTDIQPGLQISKVMM